MLILDDTKTWPRELMDQLHDEQVVDILKDHTYIEDLVKDATIRPILEQVEEYVATTPLAAYHCTKQLPDRPYSTTGLRVLDFQQHHDDFRAMLRNHPSVKPPLFAKIDKGLKDWHKNHTGLREKMLWFCIDRPWAISSGTELFFKYFGGEAIYFGFMKDPEVMALLESLGEPVVVEARISSKDLKVYQEYALGRTLVSYFAKSVNPRFNIDHREGNIPKTVPPSDIVAVHPQKEFVRAVKPKRKR